MKKILLYTITVILIFSIDQLFASKNFEPAASGIHSSIKITADSSSTKTADLSIRGMTCNSCAMIINKALKKQKGVISSKVKFGKKINSVIYNPNKTTVKEIIKTIEKAGYKAKAVTDRKTVINKKLKRTTPKK